METTVILMKTAYLIFFISISALATPKPKIELIPPPKTMEDYDHHFKGCLENSECDQVMGLQLTRWSDLIKKLKNDVSDTSKKFQLLEIFREKYGIPVEFYTYQKSQQGFKPLLYNSPCKAHNPTNGEKILQGTSFIKSIRNDNATVWRDQTQIEVPTGEILVPQPVYIYRDKNVIRYNLPLNDQPLFIRNGDLFILRQEDDFFYFLSISSSGEWKIQNIDMTRLSEWSEKRSEVNCPKDSNKADFKFFQNEFCKLIWDEDLKQKIIVKMHKGCTI